MRALTCNRPGEIAIAERTRPSPKKGQVLVRIRRAGVCGADLHIFEGSHPFLEYPRVIGHELSGEVAEIGEGSALAVGQRVYVIPYISCGHCVACRRGKTNCCQRPLATSTRANDLIWKALAPHLPDRLPAGHLLSTCGTIIAETKPSTGELAILVEPLVGGWGATHVRDGQNGQFCAGDGETFNVPIEVTEGTYGLWVERCEFHNEDGGSGKFRGGKGVTLDYRVLADEVFLTAAYGRHKFWPGSVANGKEGSRNYIEVHQLDGRKERFGKVARFRVVKGELIRLVTATGGGYGNPSEREMSKVPEDLRDGFATPAQAKADYGLGR